MKWPKVPLGIRIFLLYITFVILCGYIITRTVTSEIKPGVRQTMEETLVDMSSLIAVMVADDVRNGTLTQSRYPELLSYYSSLEAKASIWGLDKIPVNKRIYITNGSGSVILDSAGLDVGKDYSRWNDVYLTLRGKYGARSTKSNPLDDSSTVMYVASPIMNGEKIIGSVTVAKANRAMQPFIERSQNRLISWGIFLGIIAIIIGALLAWRITRALNRLSYYAEQAIEGKKIAAPTFRMSYEFGELALVLDKMRHQLEGKNYAEHYVQTLTHELKSPLAAIKGASEILQTPISDDSRQRFLENIENESNRVHLLIDRMLKLSIVEQKQVIENRQTFDLKDVLIQAFRGLESRFTAKHILSSMNFTSNGKISGDAFLLQQAVVNLLENALEFTPDNGVVTLSTEHKSGYIHVVVFNNGDAIPEYALSKITERFYSLPRPQTGMKSTGLGLNFVLEVAQLHQAKLQITNVSEGVEARLIFK